MSLRLEKISQDVGEQKQGLDELDTRVTVAEQTVADVGVELGETRLGVGELRQDVQGQGEALSDVQTTLEQTALAVQAIDKKVGARPRVDRQSRAGKHITHN